MTNKDNKEVELKFVVSDTGAIRQQLSAFGFNCLGKAFEKTIRFDYPDGGLENTGRFLRLRSGFKNTLTFKKKIVSKEFKEREEIELEVGDLEKMKMILEKLGYTKILIMEKEREKWSNDDVEVVIDRLPMGDYIEIEGDKEKIEEVAKKLNLDFDKKMTSTYWDLWREFTKENNIYEPNIIFNYKK